MGIGGGLRQQKIAIDISFKLLKIKLESRKRVPYARKGTVSIDLMIASISTWHMEENSEKLQDVRAEMSKIFRMFHSVLESKLCKHNAIFFLPFFFVQIQVTK